MTRRRWVADESSGDRAALIGEHAAHLSRVLRAQVGQEFDISTGQAVRRGRVVSVSAERVDFALGEAVEEAAVRPVTVALAIFKFDRYEWAIEKLTELGVSRIVPLIAQRTEAHLAKAAGKRAERWRRIAISAAEQSRRAAVPQIGDPVDLQSLAAEGMRVVLVEPNAQTGQAPSLHHVLCAHASDLALTLAIGPEGGWTARELEYFRKAGWESASLGPQVLRAETAAIAAVAIATL